MDARLYNTADGGEIDCVSGSPVLDDGLSTAVYLSLFGGNEEDSGLTVDDSLEWWGNKEEPLAERRYRSETQALLQSMPATSSNLLRLEHGVTRDLQWMTDSGVATTVAAQASIPALNTVRIQIAVEIDGRVFPIMFTVPWPTVQ